MRTFDADGSRCMAECFLVPIQRWMGTFYLLPAARGDVKPRQGNPRLPAAGAPPGSRKAAALLEDEAAGQAFGGLDVKGPAGGGQAAADVGQVLRDLFFGNAQGLGNVALVAGRLLEQGDQALDRKSVV